MQWKSELTIGKKVISIKNPSYFIADVASNHDGDIERARVLIFLAKESGLSVWFEHHLYDSLLPSAYTKWLYSYKTSLWPNHRGLFKTTAFQTIIMPTQGTASVSLMLGKTIPYLPTRWEGRPFHSLTAQDTPLLNQIKFMEIKLRHGNLLILPAHIIVDIRSIEKAWCFVAEIHHPISRLA